MPFLSKKLQIHDALLLTTTAATEGIGKQYKEGPNKSHLLITCLSTQIFWGDFFSFINIKCGQDARNCICNITVTLNNTPQPTEVGQYKNNSCTLKPKTKFSFN